MTSLSSDDLMPSKPRCRIVIFAKAPRPGFAKTRLIPVLGAQGAAELAKRLLIHTLTTLLDSNKVASVELCVTPPGGDQAWLDPEIQKLARGIQWTDQGDGNLGERLSRVAHRVIESGESVIFIGSDCPELGTQEITDAITSLCYEASRFDATLFPTRDGGYALLGLNRFHSSLFENIPWSTAKVTEETLKRLEILRWNVKVHRVVQDVDIPQDLELLKNYSDLGYADILFPMQPLLTSFRT